MATTTRPIRLDLQDQPQAPADAPSRPIVTNEPERRPAPPRRRMPAWSWVALAFLAALVIAVVATALHARTTPPAAQTAPTVASRSVVPEQTRDPHNVAHRPAGRLVDGSGAPVVITGSTHLQPRLSLRPYLPSSHVIAHALGWVGGRASM